MVTLTLVQVTHPALLLTLCPLTDLTQRLCWATEIHRFSSDELTKAGADEEFLKRLEGIVAKLEGMVE